MHSRTPVLWVGRWKCTRFKDQVMHQISASVKYIHELQNGVFTIYVGVFISDMYIRMYSTYGTIVHIVLQTYLTCTYYTRIHTFVCNKYIVCLVIFFLCTLYVHTYLVDCMYICMYQGG